jgi:putative ABC transport system permease protein
LDRVAERRSDPVKSPQDRPNLTPPRLGVRLLGRLLPDTDRAEVTGDFEERFQTKALERGATAARIWYGTQVLRLVPYLLRDHILWSGIMFKNNLVIAWRNIKRSKVYSALNILGLAVGMAVFILIMLYVRYELSYDRYHANARNIYRVICESPGVYYLGSNVWAATPAPLAPAMVRDIPEVIGATRIKVSNDALISIGDKHFSEKQFFWADAQIFKIFSFPLVRGDRSTVLKHPFSILLSEGAARRFFGDGDPLGRTIGCTVYNVTSEFRVDGVFRDIPANSHFVMDIVAPFDT